MAWCRTYLLRYIIVILFDSDLRCSDQLLLAFWGIRIFWLFLSEFQGKFCSNLSFAVLVARQCRDLEICHHSYRIVNFLSVFTPSIKIQLRADIFFGIFSERKKIIWKICGFIGRLLLWKWIFLIHDESNCSHLNL